MRLALQTLLSDPALRSAMGSEAARVVAEFSLERMAGQTTLLPIVCRNRRPPMMAR
jgi:glycosyltransferase involved in cell wall biosynthesis